MVGVSPSYNIATVSLPNTQTDILGNVTSNVDVDSITNELNIFGAVPIIGDWTVGPYRTLTGLVDLIRGIYNRIINGDLTSSGRLIEQGFKNIGRGFIESSLMICCLYDSYYHSLQSRVSIQLPKIPIEGFFTLFIGRVLLLLAYDLLALSYYDNAIKKINNDGRVKLYYDGKPYKSLQPRGFHILTVDSWVAEVERYGTTCTND